MTLSNEKMGGKKKGTTWIYIILIYVGIATAILGWCFSFDSPRLRSQLVSIIPWVLDVNFLLIVIGIALNGPAIRKQFKGVSSRQWCAVLGVVMLGIVLAAFVAPRVHRIYYDENIYLNIGQTIAVEKKAAMCAEGFNRYGEYHCAQLEHNKQPYAFPHLISILYRLFGASEMAGFLFNNVIFGLSILVSFLLGLLFFGRFSGGIYTGLIFCLIPENIIWSNTAAVEPSAALFSAMVVTSALLCSKERSRETLFLLCVLLPYSVQFRNESILILPVIGLIFLLRRKEVLRNRETYILFALSFALVMPHIVQLYAVRGESWGSPGPRMGLAYFLNNVEVNSLFYFKNARLPLVFTLLVFGGILLRGNTQARLVLMTWFSMFWGVFLFFYAGSYEFGQDVRFSVVSYMPLSLLAGLGIEKLERLLESRNLTGTFRIVFLATILFSFTGFLPHIRAIGEESCQARADHRYAKEMARLLPENSVVLTHNPNMFLLWGKNAAQAAFATHNRPLIDYFFQRYTGGVYFHYNYWCNVNNPKEAMFCQNILNNYEHTEVIRYEEHGYTFALYRLEVNRPSSGEAAEEDIECGKATAPSI